MMRVLHTTVFFLLTCILHGQRTALFPDLKPKTQLLTPILNEAGDSLTLKSSEIIKKVQIFNIDFDQTITVGAPQVTIPLDDIPLGKFAVETYLDGNLIAYTLLREEYLDPNKAHLKRRKKTSLFIDFSIDNMITTSRFYKSNQSEAPISSNQTPKQKTKSNLASNSGLNSDSSDEKSQTYWILYKTNNAYGAVTVKRFADQELVDTMISNINLDKRTKAGKYNELTVWEIYNISEFINYKLKTDDTLKVEDDSFNPQPYFKTENNLKRF
jgi:hypothetical protein